MRSTYTSPTEQASRHLVRFFEAPSALADTLSSFVGEGLARGETALVVVQPAHWLLTLERLGTRGLTVSRAVLLGQLMVLDATDTLASCMRNGMPDRARFDESIGNLVRRLAAAGSGLRIFGEMVDVLAGRGNFHAAVALEELWNGLATQCTYTLLCGYSSVHFGDPRSTGELNLICHLHARRSTAFGTRRDARSSSR